MDLHHPNSVWDVTVTESGDVVTACGDSVLRVFSNNPSYWLSAEEITNYNNMCLLEPTNNETTEKEMAQKNPSVNQLLPIDYIYNNKGKEGEIRAFNNKGKGECYMFQNGKWEKIGDVIGGEEDSKNSKQGQVTSNSTLGSKYYPGDTHFPAGEYDFIFDVELDHKTTKLPFNYDGNKLVSAQKFCRREGLHVRYQDDIINFLKANTGLKPSINKQEPKEGVSNYASNLLNQIKLPSVTLKLINFI